MSYGETRDQQLSQFVARIADAKKFKGGSWRSSGDSSGMVAGGFMCPGAGIASSSIKMNKVEKIDFGDSRPKLVKVDRETIAKVLDRPFVDEAVAAELISKL